MFKRTTKISSILLTAFLISCSPSGETADRNERECSLDAPYSFNFEQAQYYSLPEIEFRFKLDYEWQIKLPVFAQQNFYYYHIPSFTGVDYSMVDFIKCASERIHNFSGIKYTHDNLNEMKECITINKGNLRIFHGNDEMLLKGLSQGVKSAVGSTYNFMPSIYLCLIENYFKGYKERAKFKQSQANEITNILFKYGGPIIAVKVIMRLIGIDLGS